MKYLILIVFQFLFFSSAVFGQHLSFDDLVRIQKMKAPDANDFMLKKGWEFSNSAPEISGIYSQITWAYGKSKVVADEADSWLIFYFAENLKSRVHYQTHDKGDYTFVKSRITALGMKLINTKVKDDIIYSDYEGATTVVRVVFSSKTTPTSPSFHFYLFLKDDYEIFKLQE